MILKEIQNFDLNQIANSGQCFRWKRTRENAYLVIHKDKVVTISQLGGGAFRLDCSEEDFTNTWKQYFDLSEDYGKIIKSIDPRDEYLMAAGQTAQGIRILRQDPWETIASFIISQRNNIPRIKGTIERLCQVYGQGIPDNGSLVYTFPTPEAIANAPKEELEALGAYYRAEYLIEAARNHQGRTDAGAAADREEAYKTLTGFLGIGPKVANCICLFGLHFTEAFPRDTWISRIEENHYHGHFPVHKYPGTAGIMQQYMFYYERMQQGKI